MDLRTSEVAYLMNKIKYEVKNLKIHKDKRGWLVELLKANELRKPIKQLHIASLETGIARGNHYHSKRTEWFFIVAGKAKLVLQDIKTKEKKLFILSSKKPRVITIFPKTAHSVKNIGKETVYLVAAQNDIYNPKKPDNFPWVTQ